MSDPIDIHDPINELCQRLGLDPSNVASILFQPTTVTAMVYKTDANGSKYLEDASTGRTAAAIEERIFEVIT